MQKNSDNDFKESLLIFKLILRFQNDPNLNGKREKLLADYIVQKGLANLNIRDEILCQLCNQTWKNDDEESCDRAWTLMIHCLSSFSPSPLLYKYLLKYVSDHAPNITRPILQRLLLINDHVEPYNCRAYPGSLLEWKAMSKNCGTSLELNIANGDSKYCQVDPWNTSEQITSELLKSVGFFNNHTGWSIDFEDNDGVYTMNGDDYIFDMVSQMELYPTFPASKNYFIGCGNQLRSSNKNLLNPFHNPDLVNKFTVDEIINQNLDNKLPERIDHSQQKHMFLKSNVRHLNQKMLRSMSGETLVRTDGDDGTVFGLAMHSKLNERYLKNASSFATFSHLVEEPEQEKCQELKLSEKSRLNQRYISNHKQLDTPVMNQKSKEFRNNRKNLYTRKGSDKQSNKLMKQRSISMQELGLANSSLNIRYFSRDKLNKTSSLNGGSDNDSDSFNQPVHNSLLNFNNDDSSLTSENNNGKHFRKKTQTSNDNRGSVPAHRKSPHIIRPGSSTSSSFDSDSSINDTESANCNENKENHKRYKKYTNQPGLSKSQQFLNNRYKEPILQTDYHSIKGSAMSDTSEAPSLAMHVRNLGMPSHASELDQYLDDLFNPVLDAQLDDAMSDARSLAQSIKGENTDNQDKFNEKEENWLILIDQLLDEEKLIDDLINSKKLSKFLMGGVNEIEVKELVRFYFKFN